MVKVWHAHPWVVALGGDMLYRGKYMNGREEAAEKIRAGASPEDVFGWSGQWVPLADVRSVEWVPTAGTLLVKRHWLRDTWRLTFPGAEKAFRTLSGLMPDPSNGSRALQTATPIAVNSLWTIGSRQPPTRGLRASRAHCCSRPTR